MTAATISGFAVLHAASETYCGIDRQPFEPKPTEDGSPCPHAWRREAERIFNAEYVEIDIGEEGVVQLIRERDAALQIKRLIEPVLGPHDVLQVRASLLALAISPPQDSSFLGFDVAYPGGDYYSAIRNGLFVNPNRDLRLAFWSKLNRNGLFPASDVLDEYCRRFKELVPSERQSTFWSYALSAVEPY